MITLRLYNIPSPQSSLVLLGPTVPLLMNLLPIVTVLPSLKMWCKWDCTAQIPVWLLDPVRCPKMGQGPSLLLFSRTGWHGGSMVLLLSNNGRLFESFSLIVFLLHLPLLPFLQSSSFLFLLSSKMVRTLECTYLPLGWKTRSAISQYGGMHSLTLPSCFPNLN